MRTRAPGWKRETRSSDETEGGGSRETPPESARNGVAVMPLSKARAGEDVAHEQPRAGALQRAKEPPTALGAGRQTPQVRDVHRAPPVTCGRSSEMGHVISELTGPFWAACREGGSISELKGDFSLFASEMSSETATLKALRWISELKSQHHPLR